jgi:thiol-disulfide isomerase/thioredoxin
MPNLASKITSLLCLMAFLGLVPAASAEVPATLVTGAVANFAVTTPPKPAPEINFVDIDGKPMTLSAFRGKVVFLNFWATWCAPCRREMPDIDALQAKYGPAGLAVVALSADRKGPSVIPPFYEQTGVEHLAVYNDRSMKSNRAFRVVGLPTTVILDRQGREVGRLIGPAEWASPEALALIGHLVGETELSPLKKASTGG